MSRPSCVSDWLSCHHHHSHHNTIYKSLTHLQAQLAVRGASVKMKILVMNLTVFILDRLRILCFFISVDCSGDTFVCDWTEWCQALFQHLQSLWERKRKGQWWGWWSQTLIRIWSSLRRIRGTIFRVWSTVFRIWGTFIWLWGTCCCCTIIQCTIFRIWSTSCCSIL